MTITRRGLLIAGVCVLSASAALAHGPTRKKHIEAIEINAPAAKVWERISKFDDMSWHPVVARTEGKGGNEKGATRKLILQGDGTATIDEELDKYDAAKMTYSYRITNVDVKVLPVTNYSSTITIMENGEGKSKVEWKGAFYRGYPNNDPPPELNEEAAIKAVGGVYRAGLEALKAEMEKGGS
jgi:Polyketide cyclase / dehydrase and lipid transport